MEAQQALTQIEVGDTITVNDMDTKLTVTDTMFDGEMVELEGPRGGSKSLVQNVNNREYIAFSENNTKKAVATDIQFH